ncbi:hypothetical protein ACFIQF_05020 [Comamonas sp. J-3]
MKYEYKNFAKSAQALRRKDCKCGAMPLHLAAAGSAPVYKIIDRV